MAPFVGVPTLDVANDVRTLRIPNRPVAGGSALAALTLAIAPGLGDVDLAAVLGLVAGAVHPPPSWARCS